MDGRTPIGTRDPAPVQLRRDALSNTRRALFAIPSFRGGGAEHVFLLLLNGLAARGYEMHVAVCQREGVWLKDLSPLVRVHDLKAPRVRQAAWGLTRLVQSLKPQSLLTTSTHLNTLAGLCRPLFPRGTRLLLREVTVVHLQPGRPNASNGLQPGRPGAINRVLLKHAYRNADTVICQTDGLKQLVIEKLGLPEERVHRIYNPLVFDGAPRQRKPPLPGAPRRLLAVGRLDDTKAFDRLVAALPALRRICPGSTLRILGEGPNRQALERQIDSLGLRGAVEMPGFHKVTSRDFDGADLFALTSSFEGLPNALLEAVAAECPFVVLDHPGGTREVLERIQQSPRLTTQLERWDADWFQPLSRETIELARRNFAVDSIVDEYARMLFPEACEERLAA
jgi:glycosyltransferase involved in cell wall biosynthesis